MANPDHVALAMQGTQALEEWWRQHPDGQLDLRECVLPRADLREAVLQEAVLVRADLRGADLCGANLVRANLLGADLRGANLIGANLREAALGGARFSGAATGQTILGAVDLQSTRDLSSVNHFGPSVVGTDTLRESGGRIPTEFLKGCGLHDWEIEAARLYDPELSPSQIVDVQQRVYDLRAEPLIQFYSAFISYSHADRAFARGLHDALQEMGVRCWLDEHQVLPGDDIYEQVDRGIRLWDKTLLCASEAALTSWWVDKEIKRALAKEQALTKKLGCQVNALIPLDLDGFLFNEKCPSAVAEFIKPRHAEDFRNWRRNRPKLDAAIGRVRRALRTDDGGRCLPPTPQQ